MIMSISGLKTRGPSIYEYLGPEELHNFGRTCQAIHKNCSNYLLNKLKILWQKVWEADHLLPIPTALDKVPPFFVERELIHRFNSQWDRYSLKKEEIYKHFNLSPTISKAELIAFFSNPENLSKLWVFLTGVSSIAEEREWTSTLQEVLCHYDQDAYFLKKFINLIKLPRFDGNSNVIKVREIFDTAILEMREENEGDEKALIEGEGDLKEKEEEWVIKKLRSYFSLQGFFHKDRYFYEVGHFCHLMKAIEVVHRPWIILLADLLKDPSYQLLPHQEIMKVLSSGKGIAPFDLEHALGSIPEPSDYSFTLAHHFRLHHFFNVETYHLPDGDIQTQDKAKKLAKFIQKYEKVKKIKCVERFDTIAEAQSYFEIFQKSGKIIDFTNCLTSNSTDRTKHNNKVEKIFNIAFTIFAIVVPILVGIGTFFGITGPLGGVLMISAIMAILTAFCTFVTRYGILERVHNKDWSKNLTKHMIFSPPNTIS